MNLTNPKNIIAGIFHSAVESVNPYNAVKNNMQIKDHELLVNQKSEKLSFTLPDYENIYVVGCGKAAVPMGNAIEEIMGSYITKGILTTKYGHTGNKKLNTIILDEAGHPEPDKAGESSCKNAIEMLKAATDKDLVIALISGGGSALWPQPPREISLTEKTLLSKILLQSGASIHEMNTIRKHCSTIKGGWGAKHAFPSELLAFVISDVIGDQLDVIASGPFFPDHSTFQQAREIIDYYNIRTKIPPSILTYIDNGINGIVSETPKTGDDVFENIHHLIVGSNTIALDAAAEKAKKSGFNVSVIDTPLQGEARESARYFVQEAITQSMRRSTPFCLLAGGETTVTIKDECGKGGRNQEFSLSAAHDIEGMHNIVIASCATDGNDGPTDAAGAIVDGSTIERSKKLGLDAKESLAKHDAYPFFNKLDDLLITGPTNTNVADIQIAFVF